MIGGAVSAHRRGWITRAGIDWLITAHLAVLSVGATLHSNYVVWLLPLFPLLIVTDSPVRVIPPLQS
jgi:hypothetical protein